MSLLRGLVAVALISLLSVAARAGVHAPVQVLMLNGSPYHRGQVQGEKLRTQIDAVVLAWKKSIHAATKREADDVLREFLATTDFRSAARRWTPDLLEEVRGIADGSGQPEATMFAFQLVDEIWVYLNRLEAHHCTSFGVAGDAGRPVRLGQNMDLESFRDPYQVLLRIEDAGGEQLVFTCAGMVALNGLNSHGVGICCNTLMQLKASTDGLPVAFVLRGVLACHDAASARQFLTGVHHASGQNYVLGAGDQVWDFEASANRVVEVPPDARGRLTHTNHPLVNDDLKPWLQTPTAPDSNTAQRLAAIRTRLASAALDDVAAIQAALRAPPVCVSLSWFNSGCTFGSEIMTLGPTPSLLIAAGPPDHSEYQTFTFAAPRR